MPRKTLAALTTALLLAATARADDGEAKAVEKAIADLTRAFEEADADPVKALMTDDHVAVTPYYGGPQGRDEQLKGLADHKLTEYKAGKMRVRMLGKGAALVTYQETALGDKWCSARGCPQARPSYRAAHVHKDNGPSGASCIDSAARRTGGS